MHEVVLTVDGYEAECEQAKDGTWSCIVPALPIILTSGSTLEESRVMVSEAIRVWHKEHSEGNLSWRS